MKLFDTLLASPAIQMFGWALLHSLWQGIILAILLKGALTLLRKASANMRYLVACLTLSLMLILPVSTALWSNSGKQVTDFGKTIFQNEKIATLPGTTLQTNTSETESSYSSLVYQAERQLLPWTVFIWLIGVFISSLRLFGVWNYTRRLKLNGKHLVLEQWRETLQKLCRQLKISRPVILFESSLVKVPMVIGWLKPVILIPSCALTGLAPHQFELILAHELAHIRRHDYLINLFQTVIETFLFFHPAAWWVSSQIRNERENACDDLAVSVGGNAVVYARTLVALERLRKTEQTLAMAADGGSLTGRIHRLVGVETAHSERFAGFWVVIFISLVVVTFGVTKQKPSLITELVGDELFLNSPSLNNAQLKGKMIEDSKRQIAEESRKSRNLTEEPAINLPELPVDELKADQTDGLQEDIENLQESKSGNQDESEDFIDEMASVGYTNLSVSQLVRLREADITAQYVRSLSAVGLNHLTVEELWRLGINEITPAYIQAIRNAGYTKLRAKEFALLKEHDVTPADLNKLRAEGYNNLSVWEIIRLADFAALNNKQLTRSRERDGVKESDEPSAPPIPLLPSSETPSPLPIRRQGNSSLK